MESAPPMLPLGVVVRMTGLSAHVIRAWERRHSAVVPLRTAAGTRRYSAGDVERLRKLKAATDAGLPIGEAARLTDRDLRRFGNALRERGPVDELLERAVRFDVAGVDHGLSSRMYLLGPRRFCVEVATPLMLEVGRRWQDRGMSPAVEHLLSSSLRTLLGSALRSSSAARVPILFSTLQGERHEFGALVAALASMDSDVFPVFVGGDLPAEAIAAAAKKSGAAAVAVSLTMSAPSQALSALALALPPDRELWVGGRAAEQAPLPLSATYIPNLGELDFACVRIARRLGR